MKTLGTLAAIAMAAAPISSQANAQAGAPGGNREYIQLVQSFCSTIVGSEAFPLLNWGECMSFNVVSDDGFLTAFCKALREGHEGGLEEWGFTDFDDCVRNLEF